LIQVGGERKGRAFMMSVSPVRASINHMRLDALMEGQRSAGREYLSASFRREWADVHAYAASIVADENRSPFTCQMAKVLAAATSYVGNVPAGKQPNYYQYMDGQMLDWYLEPDTAATGDLISRCVEGIHVLLKTLHSFETRSLDGLEPYHREYFDETRIRRRIELIEEFLEKTQQFGACGEEDTVCLDDPLESFAASVSRKSGLVHLMGAPLTQSHDEVLFIRVLQASELCFLGIRLSVSAAITAITAGEASAAVAKLETARQFAQLLWELLRVLHTMPAEHFATFRLLTGKASALQSIGFHLMDTLLHGLNTEKLEHFSRIAHLKPVLCFCDPEFISLKQAVINTEENHPKWREVWVACRQLDKDLLTWRGLHLGFAKRYIPPGAPGTGGTSGARYLQQHLFRGIFDDHEPDWELVREMFPDVESNGHGHSMPSVLIVP
jgi:tryptophan 2,3-dioxygenase